jgi:hypothetical protein
MKPALLASVITAAFVGVVAIATVPAVMANPTPTPAVNAAIAIPEKVDNFQLTDHTRLAHELYYFKTAPAIVIMTQANGSAVSRDAAVALQQVANTYKQRGVLVYMLNSTPGATREQTSAELARINVTIPTLMDETQLVGENMGVTREAEVYVLDPKTWRVAYHGPIDNRFAGSRVNASARVTDPMLTRALDSVLAGQPVAQARVNQTAGQTIAFPLRARASEFANISYTHTVAPILQAKCVSCHQRGGIAPFAMDSYEVVKGFAPMIRESVRAERMPPYFPDQHIGHFKNEQGLTNTETQTLIHWIEAGAPRGQGEDILRTQASEAPEWPASLGRPDVVIDLPAFNVPAQGIIAYQNQRVDNPFTQDTWLRAIAIKPGDRRVLHHVVSNHVPDPTRPRARIPGGSVGSYTPGAEPQIMADNSGAPVPAGGRLNFQMHYTSAGTPITDHTQVGFYVLNAPPRFIKRSSVIGDFALSIPAGEARHQEIAYLTFPADAYLYTLYPHAHYRGYHVELKMKTPDGRETMLLSLPKYDFNWQRDYDPIEPIHVTAGTKLIATWVYDNSPANRMLHEETRDSAGSPIPSYTQNVTWGEQTFQEMMYFRLNYRWADETVDNVRNDLQQQLDASRNIGALDDNADDLVQPDELRGPMARLRANFAQLDLDHNGGLSAAELASGNVSRAATRELQRNQEDTPDL